MKRKQFLTSTNILPQELVDLNQEHTTLFRGRRIHGFLLDFDIYTSNQFYSVDLPNLAKLNLTELEFE